MVIEGVRATASLKYNNPNNTNYEEDEGTEDYEDEDGEESGVLNKINFSWKSIDLLLDKMDIGRIYNYYTSQQPCWGLDTFQDNEMQSFGLIINYTYKVVICLVCNFAIVPIALYTSTNLDITIRKTSVRARGFLSLPVVFISF